MLMPRTQRADSDNIEVRANPSLLSIDRERERFGACPIVNLSLPKHGQVEALTVTYALHERVPMGYHYFFNGANCRRRWNGHASLRGHKRRE